MFQKLMERVLVYCRGFAEAGIEDIVIYSKGGKEHMGVFKE